METRTLTLRDALDLAAIIRACQTTDSVAVLEDDLAVQYGTMRSVGDEQGNFLRADEDVRDAYVRITMRSGWERFMPIHDALRLVRKDYMVFGVTE